MSHLSNTDHKLLTGSSLIAWLTGLVSECTGSEFWKLASNYILHSICTINVFVGEEEGYNVPKVSPCPEVGQYLHMPLAQLANQIPRDMEGVAKRLFCDGYMYLYQSRSMSLYR